MNDIGTRLRKARIKKGLNQGELAELLQCSSKAISRYEIIATWIKYMILLKCVSVLMLI